MGIHSAADRPGVLALEKMGRAGGELDDFDATLHRAHRVEKYFPVLLADDQRELLLMLLHELAEPRQDPRPAKGRGRPPLSRQGRRPPDWRTGQRARPDRSRGW